MATYSDAKIIGGLALLIARETVETSAPDDLENFDLITAKQLPVMDRGGNVEIGLGLDAFIGSFIALVLPEVRTAITLLVRKGMVLLEHHAEAYMTRKWDVKPRQKQKDNVISSEKIKEARAWT